jgi:hypothetical protein
LRREAEGTLVTHAELGARVGGYPSDMVVDSEDRAFVGEFGFDLFGGAPLEMAACCASIQMELSTRVVRHRQRDI